MSRTVAVIEQEIVAVKNANPSWISDRGDKDLIAALTTEKNNLNSGKCMLHCCSRIFYLY